MDWRWTVGFNVLIVGAYFAISTTILRGLIRTGQLRSNRLAVATAAIFATCGLHHGHHALHLVWSFGHPAQELAAVRHAFGGLHGIFVDLLGAAVALVYLGLRHSYGALLNTPAMFDDAVRLETERRLRELAFMDQLTGVDNRAAYQAHADALAGLDETVSVLFIDVDGFKTVNDAYGHEAGDRLLRQMAQRMAEGTRSSERLFRLGGDEFVVVARDCDAQAAAALAARYRLLAAEPVALREGPVVLPASVGIATGSAREGIDTLLRDADMAMYLAKREQLGVAHAGRPSPI